MSTFVGSNSSSRRLIELAAVYSPLLIVLSALSPEGRGESLFVCEIVLPCRVQVHLLLPLCVHVLVIELWCQMRRGFLSTSSLGWLVCWCVHWAWRAPPKLLHMSALPKPSGLCFYSMSCSSEMIFIPLGILDNFSWPPLINHILGPVSLTLARDCIILYQKQHGTPNRGLSFDACVAAALFSLQARGEPFGTAL